MFITQNMFFKQSVMIFWIERKHIMEEIFMSTKIFMSIINKENNVVIFLFVGYMQLQSRYCIYWVWCR